jgi:carbon storage regulator
MLVLSRKKSESIIIDNDIKVTIIEIMGNKVRLGIEAPKEKEVHREEIWLQLQKSKLTEDEQLQKSKTGF